jgi:hypothetical protein
MAQRRDDVTQAREIPLPSAEAQRIIQQREAEYQHPYPRIDAGYGTEHIVSTGEQARAGIQDERRKDGYRQGSTEVHHQLLAASSLDKGATSRVTPVDLRRARDHTRSHVGSSTMALRDSEQHM